MDENSRIETGGKTSPSLAEIARKLNLTARQRLRLVQAAPLPPIILLSDDTRLPDPATALANLPHGSGFIFRHYNDPHRKQTAMPLRNLARSKDILFLVAGDIELAVALEADGCHMPEHRLADLARCRETFRFNTAAAHTGEALASAADHGANAALLSPVFPTKSHPAVESLGVAEANTLAIAASLPVYALGGVNLQTAPDLLGSAFAGLAAIEGLAAPEIPGA